jgi:hypothetical protein
MFPRNAGGHLPNYVDLRIAFFVVTTVRTSKQTFSTVCIPRRMLLGLSEERRRDAGSRNVLMGESGEGHSFRDMGRILTWMAGMFGRLCGLDSSGSRKGQWRALTNTEANLRATVKDEEFLTK